jgi:galactokinase/mevalonate kinase-like predicted kinase
MALAPGPGRLGPAPAAGRDIGVECQTIRVPTGVQDYRPALYGGIAAIELRVEGIKRVALDVDPHELEQRIVLAYTGAPRNSGTNNWDITKRHTDGDRHIFDCFERIRDTAVAMRAALQRGDWDEVGRQIATEWENRKRLAPGVTTPAIEDLIARGARLARPRQGVRRGRRRMSLLLRSPRIAHLDCGGARRRRRTAARLPHRDGRSQAWITSRFRGS